MASSIFHSNLTDARVSSESNTRARCWTLEILGRWIVCVVFLAGIDWFWAYLTIALLPLGQWIPKGEGCNIWWLNTHFYPSLIFRDSWKKAILQVTRCKNIGYCCLLKMQTSARSFKKVILHNITKQAIRFKTQSYVPKWNASVIRLNQQYRVFFTLTNITYGFQNVFLLTWRMWFAVYKDKSSLNEFIISVEQHKSHICSAVVSLNWF